MAENTMCWSTAESVMGHTDRLIFHGPPGTGKSYFPVKWAKDNGFASVSFTLHGESMPCDVEGTWLIKEGNMVWADGYITAAWRKSHGHPKGVVVVINEIDHASAPVMSKLHNGLDDPEIARFDLPNGETVLPAGGKVLYVATMNGEPEDLPEALRDRFDVTLHIQTPHPDAIASLPEDLQSLAINSALVDDDERRVSIRKFFAFARLRSKITEKMAATAVFGENRAEELIQALQIARSA